MTLEELVAEYVRKAEAVFGEIRIREAPEGLEEDRVRRVVESARRYLDDSRFYRKQGRLETSLASISYCEGLLDALRLLGVVEFSWPEGR